MESTPPSAQQGPQDRAQIRVRIQHVAYDRIRTALGKRLIARGFQRSRGSPRKQIDNPARSVHGNIAGHEVGRIAVHLQGKVLGDR